MRILDRVALILTIIGGINWGLIGIFKFDLVAWICGGQTAIFARIIYTLVCLAAIWCISLLFRNNEMLEDWKMTARTKVFCRRFFIMKHTCGVWKMKHRQSRYEAASLWKILWNNQPNLNLPQANITRL